MISTLYDINHFLVLPTCAFGVGQKSEKLTCKQSCHLKFKKVSIYILDPILNKSKYWEFAVKDLDLLSLFVII